MHVLVIDNYDSFVYNLVRYLEDLDCRVTVKRNDEIELDEVEQFEKILLSPGPGIPAEAGKLPELISRYAETKSMFGVCLGQQAIGEAFGADLENLSEVFHGVATPISVCVGDEPIFAGLPDRFEVGRYHSWVVDSQGFPSSLEVTARDDDGNIMALRHREFDVRGVQFHPESILTPHGRQMITNWVKGKTK